MRDQWDLMRRRAGYDMYMEEWWKHQNHGETWIAHARDLRRKIPIHNCKKGTKWLLFSRWPGLWQPASIRNFTVPPSISFFPVRRGMRGASDQRNRASTSRQREKAHHQFVFHRVWLPIVNILRKKTFCSQWSDLVLATYLVTIDDWKKKTKQRNKEPCRHRHWVLSKTPRLAVKDRHTKYESSKK